MLEEVVARAQRSVGHGCRYALGKGGMDPRSPHPWDSELRCDCCLVAETPVQTVGRGAVPIADVRVGDRVWSWTEGAMEHHPVTATYDHGPREVLKLRTNGREIVGTRNHPFLTPVPLGRLRSDRGVWGNRMWALAWKPMGSLKRGDLVVAAARYPSGRTPTRTPELMWMLGLYLADGSTWGRSVSFCVYGNLRERLRDVLSNYTDKVMRESDSHGLQIGDAELSRLLQREGVTGTSATKRVPEWVWGEPRENILAFVEGFLEGDGHVSQRGYKSWSFASCNRSMLAGFRNLCQAIGIRTSRVSQNKRRHPIVIKGVAVKSARDLWTFEAYPESTKTGTYGLASPARKISDPFVLQKISGIEPAGTAPVYDLTVDRQHNFLADGIVVHNSGFAMWCCELSRQFGDGWLNTDSILKDGKTPGGLFEQVAFADAKPGHMLVYGRSGPGTYGHIGVVSVVGPDGPTRATHCSSGNWRRLKDAIAETGIGAWKTRKDSIVVRCLSIEEP